MVFSVYYQHVGRSAVAGIILGMATSIKYYPALLIVYFLVQHDLRLVATFASSLLSPRRYFRLDDTGVQRPVARYFIGRRRVV